MPDRFMPKVIQIFNLILQKKRDRVKRSRDKKKAEANKSPNEVPTLSDDIISQEDTNKENTSKEVTNKEDSNTSAPPVGTSRVLKKGRRRILADTSLDSLSDDDSSSSPINDNSGYAGDSFSPMIVKLPFSTPFRTKQQESGIKRRRETLRGENQSIDELHNKVIILEAENSQLEEDNLELVRQNMDLKRKNEGLTKSSSDQFTWLKQMWKYCNQETRRDIKAAIEVAKDEFPKGTLRGIRDTTGINFSNPPTASNAPEAQEI